MDDKEATPVEDIEQILPPMEPAEPIQSEDQPEKPTQTEEERFQEIMGIQKDFKKELKETNKNIESLSKKIDDGKENFKGELKDFKGELNKTNQSIESLKDDNQKLSQQMDENNKNMEEKTKQPEKYGGLKQEDSREQ